jgi:hypothetical protein
MQEVQERVLIATRGTISLSPEESA